MNVCFFILFSPKLISKKTIQGLGDESREREVVGRGRHSVTPRENRFQLLLLLRLKLHAELLIKFKHVDICSYLNNLFVINGDYID